MGKKNKTGQVTTGKTTASVSSTPVVIGRPSLGPRVVIYARVPVETKQLFVKKKPKGVTESEFAERCIEHCLGKGEHPLKFDSDKKKK